MRAGQYRCQTGFTGELMPVDTTTFRVDMAHLQKVQRTIRQAGSLFPNETELLKALETAVNAAQDDESLNLYYNMANYLKQRLQEVKQHLQAPQSGVDLALDELTWSIAYLQWLVTEQKTEN